MDRHPKLSPYRTPTVSCAEDLRRGPEADTTWQVVRTAGIVFVRPGRDDLDRRPRFEPNSLL